ncbi:hypothetical protein PCA31118_02709 [Pandoraea captiosa]|uniref:DUF1508 domain-containing protein n=1 Tax=Pandoraea captiosa TaxID=2508302 RepID=A0A5E5A734_9BURK|nr:hypothetical protein PCA31118_02709 [Pandoraea captiosa]
MPSEAYYYCVDAAAQEDGAYRWVIYGYYDERGRPGLHINGTERYPSVSVACKEGAKWATENLRDAKAYTLR